MVRSNSVSRLVAVIGLAAVTALAGCASAVDAAPSPTASVPVEPTTTPTTTPTPAPAPTSDASGITGAGIGPYRLGGSYAEARTALGLLAPAAEERCPWYASTGEPETLMTYVIAVAMPDGTAADDIVNVAVQGDGTAEGSPRTAAGIGLGASEQDVLAAYPDAAPEQVLHSDSALRVIDGENAMVFQFREGAVYLITVLPGTDSIPAEYCG